MRSEDLQALAALETADDRAWIAAIGGALYGEKWQRPLGEALGLSSGYVHRLMSEGKGRLDVSVPLRRRVLDLVRREAPERLATYQHLSALLAAAEGRFAKGDKSND